MKKSNDFLVIQTTNKILNALKRRIRSPYIKALRLIATVIGIILSIVLLYNYYANPLRYEMDTAPIEKYGINTYLRGNNEYHASYLASSPFEYWYLLSPQGKVYYDGIYEFSWEKTYLHYFENNQDFDLQCNVDSETFYAFDHPESELMRFGFFSETASTGESNPIMIGIAPQEIKENYLFKMSQIDAEIDNLVSAVYQEENIIAKYRLIYDWITTNVYYDYSDASRDEVNLNAHNLYGAIVEKKAVCDGISDAFKYICNKCDLPCITIRGNTASTENDDSVGHQWNIVPIHSTWFLIDCTFDLKTDNLEADIDNPTELTYMPLNLSQHFLNIDLTLEGRTSMYEGVPGYSNDSKMYNNTFIHTHSLDNLFYHNSIETIEGIVFYGSSDYIFMPAPNGDIYFSETFEDNTYFESKNFEISTNLGNIYYALYIDYKGNLIADEYCNSMLSCYDYYKNSGIFVEKIILYTKYNNETYVTNFIRTGM